MLTWGDLVGRYSSNEVRVWFEDHCVTGAISMRNELRRPQVFAVLSAPEPRFYGRHPLVGEEAVTTIKPVNTSILLIRPECGIGGILVV